MKRIRHGKEFLQRSGVMGIAMGVVFLGITIGFSVAVGDGIPLIMGLIFAAFSVGSGIHSLWHAGKEDRPSLYEITEEPTKENPQSGETKFCPYCGTKAAENYTYCTNCGKKLP